MNGTVCLKPVQESDRDLLWNVLQKYLYEMNGLYLDEMDETGNYPYEHFDEYFTDPRRAAYLIYEGGLLIGFAMLCPYSCIGMEPDWTMAEFTVFPAFRKRGLAEEAVKMILEKHPGRWEIKYDERNPAAKRLWNKAAAPYGPQVFRPDNDETVLVFTR